MMQLSQNCENSYLIYTRKSTDDAENQKNSIAYQKAEAIRYALQEALTIAAIDVDNFCSGGIIVERHTAFKESENFSIDKDGVQHTIERPKFHKLVEFLWKGNFKGVIFLCLDRASRNKSDNAIIDRLIALNVDIRFVQAQYDKTSAGELHKDVDGMFAQHYSRVISEKVKNTNRKLRDEGICTYRAPVGYVNTGDPRNKPFDPIRAPIVKQLFEKYAEGTWSLSDLARWANEHGLTMPAVRRKRTKEEMLRDEEVLIEPAERPITINHVHTVLTSQFYIGRVRGNDKSFIPSASHTALIDDLLFQKVQLTLHSKKVSIHYTEKLNFTYRGLIRCTLCNRVYTPYEQKNHHYYGVRCAQGCLNTKRSINAEFIDLSIGSAMQSLYYTKQEAFELHKRIKSDLSIYEAKRKKEKVQFGLQLKKIKEELTYLQSNKLTLLRTGAYAAEDFIIEENTLNLKIDDLSIKLQDTGVSFTEIMKDLITLSELLKEVHLYYFIANSSEKQKIVPIIFSELKLSEKTFSFQCKKGFRVLKNHSIVLGAPKKWLSELLESKTEIKASIRDLEYIISSHKSTSASEAA